MDIMNQPSLQKLFFFYHSGIITPKENEKYWRKKLRDKNFKAWAIIKKKPIGIIKIDNKMIAIVIDENHRGKGIACSALRKLNLKGCAAEIKPNNKASMKLFKKLGFIEKKKIFELEA